MPLAISWPDDDVKALITIWGEETVQKQLKSVSRNKPVFLSISTKLQQIYNLDYSWTQVKNKIKNLTKVGYFFCFLLLLKVGLIFINTCKDHVT